MNIKTINMLLYADIKYLPKQSHGWFSLSLCFQFTLCLLFSWTEINTHTLESKESFRSSSSKNPSAMRFLWKPRTTRRRKLIASLNWRKHQSDQMCISAWRRKQSWKKKMIRSQDEEFVVASNRAPASMSMRWRKFVCRSTPFQAKWKSWLVGWLRTPYGHRVIFYGRAFIIVIIITFIFLLPPSLCEANAIVDRVARFLWNIFSHGKVLGVKVHDDVPTLSSLSIIFKECIAGRWSTSLSNVFKSFFIDTEMDKRVHDKQLVVTQPAHPDFLPATVIVLGRHHYSLRLLHLTAEDHVSTQHTHRCPTRKKALIA